jgi:predicted RNA-binding Zn-ribbon protein involved in translation (DUF1610 family)
MQYLYPKSHYIDRYDLHTIKMCLDMYHSLWDAMMEHRDEQKDMTDDEYKHEVNKCVSLYINTINGERYRHKEETVKEWMDKDQQLQDLYDNTEAPSVRCEICSGQTKVLTKSLEHELDVNSRMMFIFECLECGKRQINYADGTRKIIEPTLCPECRSEVAYKADQKGDELHTTTYCPKCSYQEVDISNHKQWLKEEESRKKSEQETLAKYRKHFCYNDKDGQQYITTFDGIKRIVEEHEAQKKKEKTPEYQKVKALKQLKVTELEKLLVDKLTKKKFTHIQFDKPEIGREVVIPFTIQDEDSQRSGDASRLAAQKIIKRVLKPTNWRLMSDGLTYRLGYLSGRLKGYESDEDLMKIV